MLYLTQFTQVAMATVAAAQVAEMREKGAFVDNAIACGHSVGEYTALACVTGVYELEALLEVVFHRGSKMHDIVPRDEFGRSITGWPPCGRRRSTSTTPTSNSSSPTSPPAPVSSCRSSTSTCAVRNMPSPAPWPADALEEEIERRREITGGKRAYIQVPGIDVPFHSDVLRVGVDEFRRSLERIAPADADPAVLIGRYIPNLVPRLFTLDRDFIAEIRDLVPAEPLDEILADYDTWIAERPKELGRRVVVELLAWQFASPVRAGSRRRTCCSPRKPPVAWRGALRRNRGQVCAHGGRPGQQHPEAARIRFTAQSKCSMSSGTAVLFGTDEDPAEEPDAEPAETVAVAETPVVAASPVPVAALSGPRPEDIPFDAADATLALIALSTKMRIDQIEALTRSSRSPTAPLAAQPIARRSGSELNLGAIDRSRRSRPDSTARPGEQAGPDHLPFGPVPPTP